MSGHKPSVADSIMEHFASRDRGGMKCQTCSGLSPELLAGIREARERGASVPAIADWLNAKIGKGKVSLHSLRAHFANKHGAK